MRYEVEKRSRLSKPDFDRIKNYLEKNAVFLGKKEMKSYLFQRPTFLRIRLITGNNNALITEKTGEYSEAGRPEKEYEIPLQKLPAFVKTKKEEGYKQCSLVHTTRYSYRLNGLKVELNEIDYLGLIIEVEAMTENKDEIPLLEKKIRHTMKELQLEELAPDEYQKMMTAIYSETLKPIEMHSFKI